VKAETEENSLIVHIEIRDFIFCISYMVLVAFEVLRMLVVLVSCCMRKLVDIYKTDK